jgi:DNA-binding GntR family transcriptional regulator
MQVRSVDPGSLGADVVSALDASSERRAIPGAYPLRTERLVQEEGVARLTARKALAVLVDEGYARRVPGLGTFVVPADQMP